MSNGELIARIIKLAQHYCQVGASSVAANDHMNKLTPETQPSQQQLEAVVVDFTNYLGYNLCGLDAALYTEDVQESKNHDEHTPTIKNNSTLVSQLLQLCQRLHDGYSGYGIAVNKGIPGVRYVLEDDVSKLRYLLNLHVIELSNESND